MSNLKNSIEKKEDSLRQVDNSEEERKDEMKDESKEDLEAVVSLFILLFNLPEDPFLVSGIQAFGPGKSLQINFSYITVFGINHPYIYRK
jgi:hypothetical protein